MSDKKKEEPTPVVEEKKEKTTPAYLMDDYPHKVIGELITDLNCLVYSRL